MKLTAWAHRVRVMGTALATAGVIFLAGCSDSADDGHHTTTTGVETGDVVIGLTDAKGDFVRYAVKVSQLTLTKKDGSVVETIAEPVEVDLAQYTEMTEFLTAATVPNGYYTKATMLVDYSAADIEVEDANGAAVKVTNIKDGDGAALSTLTVDLQLQGTTGVLIAPGVASHLTLDFDLSASNTVTYDVAGNTPESITVEPILSAELNAEAPKTHRVRGGLLSVNQTASTFTLGMRPFAHKIVKSGKNFGTFTVTSTTTTAYEISGETKTGAAGLASLAAQPDFTAVTAVGNLLFNPVRFEATEVYAGSSVAGGTLDVVTGAVTARAGNTLSVKGASLVRNDGTIIFRDTATVTLTDLTKVTRAGNGTLTTADVSVGQQVTIMGTLTNTAPTSLAMNANVVRMHVSGLRGTVVTNNSGEPLVVNLQLLNGRAPTIYNFAGTGTTGNDAIASAYDIGTGVLSRTGLTAGVEVQVLGHVTAFGAAPPDFSAATLVNLGSTPAKMEIGFGLLGVANAITVGTNSFEVTNFGNGLVHHVFKRGVATDLTSLSDTTPTLAPQAGTDGTYKGVYALKSKGVVAVYRTFGDFATALQVRLSAGDKAKQLSAMGTFDNATATLASNNISIVFK